MIAARISLKRFDSEFRKYNLLNAKANIKTIFYSKLSYPHFFHI